MNEEGKQPWASAATDGNRGLPSPVLHEVAELYRRGLCVQAYEKTRPYGMLTTWTDCSSAIWAGRLASSLGSSQLGRIIHWRNFKRHRLRLDAAAYYTHVLLDRFGPLVAANFQRDRMPAAGADASVEAVVYSLTLRASIASAFRDFVSAARWLDQAEAVKADVPWLLVSRSVLLERQDRYEEALELARASLVDNPVYRPGVQQVAHLLQVLDRDDEALHLLREIGGQTENVTVVCQLAVLEQELELFDDALASFERCLNLAPLANSHFNEWVNAHRLAIACRKRELPRALELARALDGAAYRELVGRLEAAQPSLGRVQLKVPFVRQHEVTCAPATLSALSRYWHHPVEHLELAEAICYDGTPDHSERHWAATNGFEVREFTVTWVAAVALLDRGVPFTLTTTEVTSGHLQAVIGYDELRRALLIRDPFNYYTTEALCPKFLEHYAATGPRGMAMVPVDRSELLAGIDLPDAGLYDVLHRLNRSLHLHQRDAAVVALGELEAIDPDHRLTWIGRRSLASYDANTPALLESIEGLLKLHPHAGQFQYGKLACLLEMARRPERLEYLKGLVHLPAVDPIFWLRHASELRMDGRQLPAALGWVLWALRRRPTDPYALATYADVLWDLREFETATEVYRLAACAAPRNEGFARSYFLGSRHLRRTVQAMDFLRQRFAELGGRSPWPAVTLVNSLLMEDEPLAAMVVLEEALQRRPEDGDLLLFASDTSARLGEWEKAGRFLHRAEGRAQRTAWLRSAAALADYRCDRPQMLAHWREVLSLEPLATDANRAVARLILEMENRQRALAFLEDVCTRFPGHCGLHGVWAEYTQDEPPSVRESVLRRLIEINPADGWAHRELAIVLRDQRRVDEALALADAAIALERNSPFGHCTRGEIQMGAGRLIEARRDFEAAIRLAVDTGWAIDRLLACCKTAGDRETALTLVHQQLVSQVVFGEGLVAYRAAARGVLEPAKVLGRLREARAARPDLWEAWVQELAQLRDMEALDEALSLAVAATEKFPLLPRVWFERAELHRVRLETGEASAALEKALAIHPGYADASRKLSEVALQANDLPRAREVLERACLHGPVDPLNHGYLADALWRLNHRDDALRHLRLALQLMPGYGWAWDRLREWGVALEQPQLALEVARELVASRPGEARSYQRLAQLLAADHQQEAQEVIERAVQLAPEVIENHNLKAWILAQFNRLDEAVASCHPPGFPQQPPLLQMREAWIESLRGNLARAAQRMATALAAEPTNCWGWQLLADWYLDLGKLDEAERAAEQLSQLQPHDPGPLGFAATINLRQENRPAAIGRFRRAYRLDPTYHYAGLWLFDLLLEEGDEPGASEVLQTLLRHHDHENTHARHVRLLVRQLRSREGLPIFEKLCLTRAHDGWALFTAGDALVAAGLKRGVDRAVRKHLQAPGAGNYLGAYWVERQFAAKRFAPGRRLKQLVARGTIGTEALNRYLENAAQHFQHYTAEHDASTPARIRFWANRVLGRYRAEIAASDTLWGNAIRYLIVTQQYRKVARIGGDWRERKGVESWMLYNLSTGLQLLKRPDEAWEVIRHARTLRLDREQFHAFAVRAAFEEAVHGNVDVSQTLIEEVDRELLGRTDRAILSLTRAVNAAVAGGAMTWHDSAAIRGQLVEAGDGTRIYFLAPLIRRYYWRAVRRIVAAPGLGGLNYWSWWNYLGYASVAMAMLAIFPLLVALGGVLQSFPIGAVGMIGTGLAIMLLKR